LERFMTHMSKLADVEYQALSDLLYSLPDPSSYTEFQHFLRIGCSLSFTAGHDEQGRFASAYFHHFNGYAYHIPCICFVYTINIHEYNDNVLSKFV
jgi:hypothetical protein